MKTLLAIAAVLGFSISSAAAGCAGHNTTASVDKDMKVASIATQTMSTAEDAEELKKEEKVAE